MNKMGTGILLFACAAWIGCSSPEEDLPKIEFQAGSPNEVAVGDTTPAFFLTKTFVDVNGRQAKDEKYLAYSLTSADTAIATVIGNIRLVGKNPGTVSVTARDNASGNQTETPLNLTVKPRDLAHQHGKVGTGS